MKFLPYLFKTLWRHRTRTLLTVGGSAVALFVYAVIGSARQGLDGLATRHERTLVVFQANKFCPATSRVPQDYAGPIAEVPGVAGVTPVQIFTNNCRASLDIVVFYGLPPERLQKVRDLRLVSGDWGEFEQHQDAAVIGRSVAERRRLGVGDRFTIGELSVNVAGVFESSDPTEEQYIYSHLAFLQRRSGQNSVGTVTLLEVALAPDANPEAVCTAIDDRFRAAQVPTHTRPKGAYQAASLADLYELADLTGYLGWACLGLMATLVATTSLMAVQDRRMEHAVLQTIGFSGPRVFGLVLGETSLQGVLGGLFGTAIAMGLLWWTGLAVGAEGVSVPFQPTWELTGLCMGVSAAVGLAAGIAPAVQAARLEIVSALRGG
jgi:putative ABC transport system permease protein